MNKTKQSLPLEVNDFIQKCAKKRPKFNGMKKTIKPVVVPLCLMVTITMMSCNNVNKQGGSTGVVTGIKISREIDTTYTPQTLVETFYSMLTFRDHIGAIDLFEYTLMNCPDYRLEEYAKDNEKFLNSHTPVSYEVTSVEFSPDSSRAKITAVLQMSNGTSRTEYLNAIKTKTYGWRLLEKIDGTNDYKKNNTNEILSICNTMWAFTDARGNNFILDIKGISRDEKSAKVELKKNGKIVEYLTVKPKYQDIVDETGFMGYSFNGNGNMESTIYYTSSHYSWLLAAIWDYNEGYLYENTIDYNAENKTRLKIKKVK